MHDFVQTLFGASGQRGLVEIAWTDARAPHPLNAARLFDLADLDEAADFAAQLNATPNCNVYLSAGLRRATTQARGRASDADVESVVACWADFDAPGALQAARDVADRLGITPNLVTFTGKEPHTRGQFWWLLDEPCTDLALHRRLQSAIAARLGGDPSVCNPSRVMRFIGSVAWPLKAGRTLEMTGFVERPRAERYFIEEIESKLQRAGALLPPASAKVLDFASGLDFSAAEPTHDLDSLIKRAGEPGEWHRHALLATAHLLGRGTPADVVIELLTPRLQQPGFSYVDTRNQLAVMLQGALRRGLYRPAEEAGEPSQKLEPRKQAIDIVPFGALQSRDPPDWQITGVIPEKSFGYIYGQSNTFKTFVTLDMALSIAFGRTWQGRAVKQGKVLYILGEGQGGFAHRVRAWQAARDLQDQSCEFYTIFRPIRFTDPADIGALIEAVQASGVHPDWVFVDTVQRNFGAGDPDKTQDMTVFVNAIDAVKNKFDCGIFAVHHAGKDASKGARNSSVLYASADFEMRTEREEGAPKVTLVCTKAKDWEEFGRIRLATQAHSIIDKRTGEIVSSLAICDAQQAPEDAPVGMPAGRIEEAVMRVLVDCGTLSVGEITARCGENKGSVSRALASLRAKLCVARDEETGLHFILERNQ